MTTTRPRPRALDAVSRLRVFLISRLPDVEHDAIKDAAPYFMDLELAIEELATGVVSPQVLFAPYGCDDDESDDLLTPA